MSDNYAPLWALVDGFKRAADRTRGDKQWFLFHELASTLERSIREETGDLPVKEEEQPDLVQYYSDILEALDNASTVLHRLADRQGHTIRQVDSNQARVIANRCDRALKALKKAGELP